MLLLNIRAVNFLYLKCMKFKSCFVYLLQIRILYEKQLSFQVWKETTEMTAYFLVRSHARCTVGKGSESELYKYLYHCCPKSSTKHIFVII